MDYLDEEPSQESQRPTQAARHTQARSTRGGPPDRQLLMRRGLALGVGLLVLILLALAVRGCLNAREERAMRDYARDLSSIVNETTQTGDAFFERLSDRGGLSVTEFVDEVNADRSAVDNYLSRVESLEAPDEMSSGQTALEFAYQMRSQAMTTISEQLRTALGDQGREQAIQSITRQMSVLYSSDFLYALLAQAPINQVLAERGITDVEVPGSLFVPDGVQWLDESQVEGALGGSVAEAGEADDDLTHGTGLLSTSIDGVTLEPESTALVTSEGTPELTVEVQNQGEAEESDLEVSVTVGDAAALTSTIPTIAAGETQTVTIPLTPTPSGPATVEVEVAAVPGEQVLENNTGTYEVDFG